MKQQFTIEGMSCNHCVAKVEQAVNDLAGIQKVKVDLKKGKGTVKFDEAQVAAPQIAEAITQAGYPATVA